MALVGVVPFFFFHPPIRWIQPREKGISPFGHIMHQRQAQPIGQR